MSSTLTTPVQSIDANLLNTLKDQIPLGPKQRLTKTTHDVFRDLMTKQDIQNAVIDIHIHTFTNDNVPADFMKFTKWIPPGILKAFISLKSGEFARTFGMKTQQQILDQMYKKYTNSDPKLDHIFSGLLMMDMQRAIGGGVKQDFHDQILELQVVFNKNHSVNGKVIKYRDYVLPFLALDPHNPDMFKHFLSAFTPIGNRDPRLFQDYNAIFQGVKLYPALGYLPYHPDLMEIFAICEEKQIPITSHCGGIRTHPSKKKIDVKYLDANYKVKSKTIDLKNDKAGGKDFAAYFIRPEHWDRVLFKYPNLKVNIAHLGSNDEWMAYRRGDVNGTVQRTLNLINNNKNVFADFSYAFYKKVNINAIYDLLKKDAFFQKRLMYGSDYYMCQIEKGDLGDYYNNLKEKFGPRKDICDDFFVKNAIRFMG
jgi:predicted TIM-barrel fold metal-dependent hydrolase